MVCFAPFSFQVIYAAREGGVRAWLLMLMGVGVVCMPYLYPRGGQVGKMQYMAVFLYRGWRAWNFFGSNFCSFLETQTVSEKQGGGIPKIFLGNFLKTLDDFGLWY